MNGDQGRSSPRAPWDDPALYEHLRQEQNRNRHRDGGRHATSSKAPDALDLRLLAPAPPSMTPRRWEPSVPACSCAPCAPRPS